MDLGARGGGGVETRCHGFQDSSKNALDVGIAVADGIGFNDRPDKTINCHHFWCWLSHDSVVRISCQLIPRSLEMSRLDNSLTAARKHLTCSIVQELVTPTTTG